VTLVEAKSAPHVTISCLGASGIKRAESVDNGKFVCDGAHAIRLEGTPSRNPTKAEVFACIGKCNPIDEDRYLRLRLEIPAAQ
jgi:hypothetical protein